MIYEDIGMNLLAYLIGKGVRTNKVVPQQLAEGVMGFPSITGAPCDSGCNSCADVCPTDAIHMEPEKIVLTAIDRQVLASVAVIVYGTGMSYRHAEKRSRTGRLDL